MRVNVYAEELTNETAIVESTAETGIHFYGLRFFLESSDKLHQDGNDDDRSAVTLWVPWTNAGGHDTETVRQLLYSMLDTLTAIDTRISDHKPES